MKSAIDISNSVCIPEASLNHQSIIFAHRGASGYKHENSFEAFDLAIELGAQGLETDCWLTADQTVVLHHDRFFHDHITGKKYNLPKMQLSEIKLLRLPNGEQIPTLREFFQRYSEKKIQYPTNGLKNILFSIDLQDNHVGLAIIPILKEFHVFQRTFLCTSTLWKIRGIQHKYPQEPIRFVGSNLEYQILPQYLQSLGKAKRLKLEAFNIQAARFEDEMIEPLQKANLKLFIWDLHTSFLLKKYLPYHPYAIYSNFPDKARKIQNKLNLNLRKN